MKRLIVSAFFLSLVCLSLSGEQALISYSGSRGYSLVERSNLRRYVNGKYVGLTSREVRSFISPADAPASQKAFAGSQWYDGSFYVMEATKSNSREVSGGIHDSIPSVFSISSDGQLTMHRDNGYPSFRSFPAFSRKEVQQGDAWQAQAVRAVDPLNKGVFTRIPMNVAYQFVGEEMYKEQNVYRIKARWQTNYGSLETRDPRGDSTLVRAAGNHSADVLVLKETGAAILIMDTVDETFQYSDGTTANFKGTINLFTEYPPALDAEKLIPALKRIASVAPNVQAGIARTASVGAGAVAGSSAVESGTASGRNSVGLAGSGESGSGSSGSGGGANGGVHKNGGIRAARTVEPVNTSVWLSNNVPPEEVVDSKLASAVVAAVPSSALAGEAGGAASGAGVTRGAGAAGGASVVPAAETRTESAGTDGALPKNNIVVEQTQAGIRLSVRDIRFKPDSEQIADGEGERLDEIASVLKLVPDSQLLVEGHTAAVGKPAGEQALSEERARRIAFELEKRGVSAQAFICRGFGGTRPIADNSTDSGRAQNRRVEITILR
ncbi:MAG: OmpA family protein [Treponema sp.]|nr:OmpA family protein [Treponema sp.]